MDCGLVAGKEGLKILKFIILSIIHLIYTYLWIIGDLYYEAIFPINLT